MSNTDNAGDSIRDFGAAVTRLLERIASELDIPLDKLTADLHDEGPEPTLSEDYFIRQGEREHARRAWAKPICDALYREFVKGLKQGDLP